ncbi:MAG: ATP synthase F1 subunit gamma, partial [Bacteroidetes bacterium]
ITSAMKMVAASKLRKAQNAIISLRPYAAKLTEIMQNLSASMDGSDEGIYAADRGDQKILIVAISSNRGLCGGFNINVVKETINLIETKFDAQYKKGNVSILALGKKGGDLLTSRGYAPERINKDIFDNLTFENSVPLTEQLMQEFVNKDFDKIYLIYNQFKNAAVQIIRTEQFLPVAESEEHKEESAAKQGLHKMQADFIFEPSKAEILEALVPKAIKLHLYKALLDSFAAEHGARMTAMHKATDNADELIKALNLSYNKARQAAITNEILEIVSGAEALKG